MKNIISVFILLIGIGFQSNLLAQEQESKNGLLEGFQTPPEEAKPRTWWHWTASNITKEGITKDLEWMKRSGIGGFMLFDVSFGMGQVVEDKKVVFTPEWFDMLKHATSEAERLDLEMTMHSSAGWSETGGPWVKPEEAVKKLVWSEKQIVGGKQISEKLPMPSSVIGPIRNMAKPVGGLGASGNGKPDPEFYKDQIVVAYKMPEAETRIQNLIPKTSSSFGEFDPKSLLDDDLKSGIKIPKPTEEKTSWIQYEYPSEITVQAFSIAYPLVGNYGTSNVRPGGVSVSSDGIHFSTIVSLPGTQHDIRAIPVRTFSFPEITAKYFRIEFIPGSGITTVGGPDGGGRMGGSSSKEFDLVEAKFHSGARVNRWEDKANFAVMFNFDAITTPKVQASEVIKPIDVINLSSNMNEDGTLNWEAPAGNWAILRMGYSLTGAKNGPAVPAGTGFEVDKLSADYMKSYYQGYTSMLKENLGELYGKRLQYFLVDSYEADAQNWTDKMIPEFTKRRGYDPTPYLPVLAGRIVGSSEISDRFLWDFRRTIADLLADDHYAAFAGLAHADGIKVYSEAAGISLPVIQDALLNKSKVDIPMGEFGMTQGLSAAGEWMSADELQKVHAYRGASDRMNAHQVDVREAASASHIYGKKLVATESWTGGGFEAPAALSKIGDYWNTQGVNRFIFHTSTHQPLDTKPGNSMVGAHFHRNITWAEQAKPFFTYLGRNSFMLQQGKFVADILYFLGEGIPSAVPYWKNLNPALPEGYDYDCVNTEILLEQMKVKDGKIVLNSGMEYEVLVLPDTKEMTLSVLQKIQELIREGATVIGPKPTHSPSLKNFPVEDKMMQLLANEIWGDCDGNLDFFNAYGKGQVYWGIGLEGILAEKNVSKDLQFTKPNFNTHLNWIHRQTKEADIFFISNQRDQIENVKVSLRISGKQPEIWNPVTGETKLAGYKIENGRTIVPLDLNAHESVFVVLRNQTENESLEVPVQNEKLVQLVSGEWQVDFAPNLGAPAKITLDKLASWTEDQAEGVKYFSGTATYDKEIVLSDNEIKNGKLILDLGQVKDIAEVFINGELVETLWKKPYKTDISSVVKEGKNHLEIRVTNQWTNRIAGDRLLPDGKKILSGSGLSFGRGGSDELPKSGLMGPVKIVGIN